MLKLKVVQVRDGSPERDHWHQRHISEVFDVIHMHRGVPNIYTVSTAHLTEEPEFVKPFAFVPASAAEIVEMLDDDVPEVGGVQ